MNPPQRNDLQRLAAALAGKVNGLWTIVEAASRFQTVNSEAHRARVARGMPADLSSAQAQRSVEAYGASLITRARSLSLTDDELAEVRRLVAEIQQ